MVYIGLMNTHISPLRSLAATILALLVTIGCLVVPASSVAAPSKSASVTLAPPAFAQPMTSARSKLLAAGAYVHVANCQAAIQGANGDNDVSAFIGSKSPVGIRAWSFNGDNTRFANDDVIAWMDFYNYSGYVGTAGAHCWGSDANISDRVEGW